METDCLTQLQDCLDQLLTQMYACVRYVDTHHSLAPIPGQPTFPLDKPDKDPASRDTANATSNTTAMPPNESQAVVGEYDPDKPFADPPELFQSRLRELAADLVTKEQQIEELIGMLPGVGISCAEQEARMRSLDAELRAIEGEKREAIKEKERLLARVDEIVLSVKRP